MTDVSVQPRPGWLRIFGPAALAWFVIATVTGAHFWGDSVDYVESVLDRHEFWDFGHLFWRPLGWLLAQVLLPATTWLGAEDKRAGVLMLLAAVSWLAGLFSILLFRALLSEVGIRPLAADLAVLAFLISQTFLNFVHTACSYIPGLCCLLLGLFLLARASRLPERATGLAILAGVALACALGFWFPYVWALPAAGLLPPVLGGVTRAQVRLTIITAAVCALVVILVNSGALAVQGIFTMAGARAWVASSQHGITGINGVPRMLFGLARSFIYLGADGTLYRRYLGHDPLNPVTLGELVQASLWQIGLFYLFLGGLALGLARSPRGRRLLVLLILAAIPTLGFAVAWQGGDMERYLALYPFLFLALGGLLDGERVPRICLLPAMAFFTVAAVANSLILFAPILHWREAEWRLQARVILPHLKHQEKDTLFTMNDPMARLRRDYPLDPEGHKMTTHAIVEPGTNTEAGWRADMGKRILKVWARGGDVYVTRRILAQVPQRDWLWVEDQNSDLHWAKLNDFFADLDKGETIGTDDEDGAIRITSEPFVQILDTPANRARLAPPGS